MTDEKWEGSPGWQPIQDWLQANVPNSRVEMMSPSESSRWISGYFGALRVDFSESDLATFCARWETPDGGSVDPRFQCFLMPYKTWYEKQAKYVLYRPMCRRPNLA